MTSDVLKNVFTVIINMLSLFFSSDSESVNAMLVMPVALPKKHEYFQKMSTLFHVVFCC